MSATVRFSQVINAAGKPQLHVLWGAPSADSVFQQALKSGRVMTVLQNNVGSKKDFGLVGFSQQQPAQFLIFPRSLKAFEGRRVVGINYEIFDPPPHSSSPRPTRDQAKKTPRRVLPDTKPLSTFQSPAPRAFISKEPASPAHADESQASPIPPPRRETRPHLRKTTTDKKVSAKQATTAVLDHTAVLKEVRKAMKELESGKPVLVFRRLEKLADYLVSHK